MNSKKIIKLIMNNQGVSNATLANRLDISQATLWDRLNNKASKELSIPVLMEMLRVLDYKIIITPSNKRIKDDEFEVE